MPVTINHYTRQILESGELRKRLTQNLIEVINHVAQQIADSCEEGDKVTVDGKTYEVVTVLTHKGYRNVLVTRNHSITYAFYGDKPEQDVYIDGYYGAQFYTASKADYLHFAKNFIPIIQAFEAKQEEAISELQKIFDYLATQAGQQAKQEESRA